MTGSATVELSVKGAVGWVVIKNPDRMNALTSAMWEAIPGVIAAAEQNEGVRVIVLRGDGTRAFCAGADISEFETTRTGDAAKAYDQLNHNAFMALSRTAKPTIAMIHGYCLGGGLGVAACCDLRIADDHAQFAIPAAKLGIGYNPRWVTPLLALTSPASVKEILFTGRRFNANEALTLGLVNRVADNHSLSEVTETIASQIAANAPLSVRASKAVVNELVHHPEQPDLVKLDAAVQRCFDSDDYREGRKAFLDKREPEFKGR